ncbi:glycosyltransferase [Jannaschia seohaensis]|uniref:Glycosyltransferase involved in cell wall biosynthesis n=1 Tax=Jannaschia seohaensis TaxID=475081 RepID=A0A2Y9B2I3_9RHOB|nr:glycosyltransferase [Jannaschia seohaensis]PWJ12942.1 glycosyltransferase involved in cell wall biosynthesis [Jannaschia seohaensis]SSA50750.1 Glycosyltransferase involved in cell wall bisynthesis [Jannaschia seohaensis]
MDDFGALFAVAGLDEAADIPQAVRAAPRNPWVRAQVVLARLARGDLIGAERLLDSIKYHPKLPPGIYEIYADQIAQARARMGLPAGPFNIPADYMSCADPRLHRPFRQLDPEAAYPKPYPSGLALPPPVGMSAGMPRFLEDAAARLSGEMLHRIRRIHVVVADRGGAQSARLLGMLAEQEGISAALHVTVFDPRPDAALAFPAPLKGDVVGAAVTDMAARVRLVQIAEAADLVVFLSGSVVLDPLMLRRALHYAAVSDMMVQPLMPARDEGDLSTPFSLMPVKPLSRFPFRDVLGLNMVVPAPLLRRAGPIESRFESTRCAAEELVFRLIRAGAYTAPLTVPWIEPDPSGSEERTLYRALCPNAWDRKTPKKRGEVPRVSVYIPTYNASAYIQRAVDSVLEQDFADLEVCLADDGSKDGTADLLEKLYGDEPRVRWERFQNGGIGFASNRAIRMSRAPYIGQLDSDDCLKPGAVSRLVAALDDDPGLACAYGSCERIDAEGQYLKDEYAWPVYSHEKMMITSIVHHFRMFRRAAWERTSLFREDIVNAVDYDVFLKLSEVGRMRHVEEVLYQRRWHGQNTSSVNEGFQTQNTYRVQREALARMGLDRFWDVHVPDPEEPRRVTYKRRDGAPMVLFWPDYSRSNPYQHLLYGSARQRIEICAGDIDAALRQIDLMERPDLLTFHLHWLNFLLRDIEDPAEARAQVDAFLAKIEAFVRKGGRLVWTIHNIVSHDSPHHALEVEMSSRIAALAHALHFHSAASVDEVAEVFEIPREKAHVSRHGSYVGAYSDFVTRAQARAQLGLAEDEDVILFSGQVRPYKGVEQLAQVFRRLLAERPRAVLLIAGKMVDDVWVQVTQGLSPAERARIRATRRFVTDLEMQLFFRAADVAVYPYQRILTSGSLMLALSFGVPAVIPSVGMTREVLGGTEAGLTYDAEAGEPALEAALRAVLDAKDAGRLGAMQDAARRVAEAWDWPDFGPVLTPR